MLNKAPKRLTLKGWKKLAQRLKSKIRAKLGSLRRSDFRLDSSDLDEARTKAAIRHLRSDLGDDWFPDPVASEDLLEPVFLRGRVLARKGPFDLFPSYSPAYRVERDVPKANGTLRYSLEQTIVDRFVYQFLATQLAPTLDPLISARVLSHRVRPRDSKGKLKTLFKAGVGQWCRFEELASADVEVLFVVEADVQTFYESISLDVIKHGLSSAISVANISESQKGKLNRFAKILVQHLRAWTYKADRGLPQNRDASSFLANLVMREIDDQMINDGLDYFRYMDDVRIRCKSHSEARQALALLCVRLREIGLSLNSRKTKIHAPDSEWHKEQASPADPRMRDIQNMWESKSLHLISMSLSYLSDLTSDLIDKGAVDVRAFRFCANRIINLHLCAEVEHVVPRSDELCSLAIDCLGTDGHAVDTLCKLIYALNPTVEDVANIERVLLDPAEYLHEWQAFWILRLLLQIHVSDLEYEFSDTLVRAARTALTKTDPSFPIEMAMLILGGAGEPQDRARIARMFGELGNHPHRQRAAFIAIHQLDYDREIKPYLGGSVSPHLDGALARYQKKFEALYYPKVESVPLARIARTPDEYVG